MSQKPKQNKKSRVHFLNGSLLNKNKPYFIPGTRFPITEPILFHNHQKHKSRNHKFYGIKRNKVRT